MANRKRNAGKSSRKIGRTRKSGGASGGMGFHPKHPRGQ